ncbi:aldehyde dehydrogenase family protein [Streptomyces sp. NPDC050121]|uniref:aldehyde dehydrogenase family protein n=1 Tax=Streptomyces sp. NPDC050121 TaxID=3365601 RepID=UPI0037A0E603
MTTQVDQHHGWRPRRRRQGARQIRRDQHRAGRTRGWCVPRVHPGVDKVAAAFTGSTSAGRVIGETCGHLLRPVALELGGKSATVVLDEPKP